MTLPTAEARAAGRAPVPLLIFLSLMTSVVALTVDAILPAMRQISVDLGFDSPSERHLLILLVFGGMALGQPIFGPVSDSIGRRATALIGWVIYGVGTLIAATAGTEEAMLAGRFLQGFGASGPRVVATAMVRDLYEGRAMAKLVSLVMTVFMLVPMIAPLLGQAIQALAGWHMIFGVYLALALTCTIWHVWWIPETLAEENRRPLRFGPLFEAFREVVTTRATVFYALGSAAIFGAFAAFLSSAQQIYEEILGLGALFPLVFALTAVSFAVAQYTNSRLVMRLGMRRIARIAAVIVVVPASIVLIFTLIFYGDAPPLWLFLAGIIPVFLGAALMFSNLTALALEPLGHIAGTASSVVMSTSTLLAIPLGGLIAGMIETSVVPMLAGFACLGAVTWACIELAERVRTD